MTHYIAAPSLAVWPAARKPKKDSPVLPIHGVRVEPDGTTVATDGALLAIVSPRQADLFGEPLAEGVTVDRAVAKDVYDHIPPPEDGRPDPVAELAVEGEGKVRLSVRGPAGEMTSRSRPIAGEYPDWQAQVGETPRREQAYVRLSSSKLKQALQVLAAFGAGAAVELRVYGPEDAIVLHTETDEHELAIHLAPMRGEAPPTE